MKALKKMFEGNKVCTIGKVNSNLARLKVLSDAIDFAQIGRETSETIELSTEAGSIFVVELFRNDAIGIVRSTATAGARLVRHKHDAYEAVVLYEGEMDLIFDDHVVTLNMTEKQSYYIAPDTPHAAYYIENSKTIGITIPNAY